MKILFLKIIYIYIYIVCTCCFLAVFGSWLFKKLMNPYPNPGNFATRVGDFNRIDLHKVVVRW